jgi:hypothetical protein
MTIYKLVLRVVVSATLNWADYFYFGIAIY